jgi:hypothetical protein
VVLLGQRKNCRRQVESQRVNGSSLKKSGVFVAGKSARLPKSTSAEDNLKVCLWNRFLQLKWLSVEGGSIGCRVGL